MLHDQFTPSPWEKDSAVAALWFIVDDRGWSGVPSASLDRADRVRVRIGEALCWWR